MRSCVIGSLTALVATLVVLSEPVAAGRYARSGQAESIRCDAYAREQARWGSREGQIAVGTVLGALAGFGIGSIFAASGVGAAIGAPVGLVVGAAVRRDYERDIYLSAYDRCMARRN